MKLNPAMFMKSNNDQVKLILEMQNLINIQKHTSYALH